VLVVAARPAHSDGALIDWAHYHLQQQQFVVQNMIEHEVGPHVVLSGIAVQAFSDAGPRCLLFAFLEDGGRLVSLFANGPREMEKQIVPIFEHVLQSFRLSRPKGRTVAVNPTDPVEPAAEVTGEPESEPTPEPTADEPSPAQTRSEPKWWVRACELEAQDRLDEAEAIIRDSIPHLAYAIQTAELYRLRKIRLSRQGDMAGVRKAHDSAVKWAYAYASMATSGGEGMALSLERDQFIASL
jgi:hypothetical protein